MYLYHYTSIESCNAILDSGTLRMSDYKLQKDSTELKRFEDAVRESMGAIGVFNILPEVLENPRAARVNFINATQRMMADSFIGITSFSTKGDDYSQWMNYGDHGQGVALRFKFDSLKALIKRYGGSLIQCDYTVGPSTKVRLAQWAWELDAMPSADYAGADHDIHISYIKSAARFKAEKYAQENEWRAIIIVRKITDWDRGRYHKYSGLPIMEWHRPSGEKDHCVYLPFATGLAPCLLDGIILGPEFRDEDFGNFKESITEKMKNYFCDVDGEFFSRSGLTDIFNDLKRICS